MVHKHAFEALDIFKSDTSLNSLMPFGGNSVEYLSADSLCETEKPNHRTQQDLYSPDVLNGLKISGMPNHSLV
ncbi:hypothetical protein Hdeb2414_s0011g00366471 [Helianthus debilis subsp. tardiflorus]